MPASSFSAADSVDDPRRGAVRGLLIGSGTVIGLVILLGVLSYLSPSSLSLGTMIILAPLAFVAGMLSFLSPCCLPVLSAYIAYSLQTQHDRIMATTITFFLGIATTMVALGASATVLSALLFAHLRTLTLLGGLVIIGFGILSLLGRGFSGPQMKRHSSTSAVGSYVYGATFALGWTACVGPILGSLLTLLATQGIAVLQGALLSFIYALGLGAPLIVVAAFFRRLGPGSTVWRVMRGRGFALSLGTRTMYLHTTSIISGVLLIAMGILLASGQLATLSAWAIQSPITRWILDIEDALRVFILG